MNTVQKGNSLEDQLYEMLKKEKENSSLVFGAIPSDLCKIYKKKKYPDAERRADIEFDVDVEIFRTGQDSPHNYYIFECKNHKNSVKEKEITHFSDTLSRNFRHGCKGFVVCRKGFQSGAISISESRKIGLIKLDIDGTQEIIALRAPNDHLNQNQDLDGIFRIDIQTQNLDFSAFFDGHYFSNSSSFFSSIFSKENPSYSPALTRRSVLEIEDLAFHLHSKINYLGGKVNLDAVADHLGLNISHSALRRHTETGAEILGSANFSSKTITITPSGNHRRDRFTLAHEIGHFVLGHANQLNSTPFLRDDLLRERSHKARLILRRLEKEANLFAESLLLPSTFFTVYIDCIRKKVGIEDRGHGYIFVDDQPCNYIPYNELMDNVSNFFEVSKQAIEYKLRRLNKLSDCRNSAEAKLSDLTQLFPNKTPANQTADGG